jgi:hypothetical protein
VIDPAEILPPAQRRSGKPRTEAERQREGEQLSRAYRAWQREQRDELRAAHPALMQAIDGQFRSCSLINLPGIVAWVLENREIAALSAEERPILLRYLSARLTKLREASGAPPFDDPLDDAGMNAPERTGAFLIFRELLNG